MKKLLWHMVLLFLLALPRAEAQQLPLYSQYMLNPFLLNPAVAGSDGYTSFHLTAREQWIGFDNPPSTQSFSMQTRLLRKSFSIRKKGFSSNFRSGRSGRVGVGGIAFNDKNGHVERTGFNGAYAYHIFLHNSQLSFGLAGTAFQFRVRQDELSYSDPSDPLAGGNINSSVMVPDAMAGMQFLSDNIMLGFSVAHIFQSRVRLGSETYDFRPIRHYFFTGSYFFELNREYSLEPSILLKGTEKLVIQTDFNAKLYYKDHYWGGLSYRTGNSVVVMLGMQINRLYLGYAYDYTLSSIRRYNSGSHELMLSLKLGDSTRRYRWMIRY